MGFKTFAQRIISSISAVESESVVSMGPKLNMFSMSSEKLARRDLKDLEKWYVGNSLVFTAVNVLSELSFGRGGFVKCDNEKSRKLCEKAVSLPAFKPTTIGAVAHTLLYGQAFQEIIWSDDDTGPDIEGYTLIDPKSIEPFWNKHGLILRFEQKVSLASSDKKPKFIIYEQLDDDGTPGKRNINPKIAFYRFYRIGDSMNGIGIVEPIYNDLEIYQDTKLSIKEIFRKFAYAQYHIKKEGAKTRKEIVALQKLMKGFMRNSFLATSERYKVELIEGGKAIPKLNRESETILDAIIAGLRLPKPFLLGRPETSGLGVGDIKTLLEQNQFEIQKMQEKISQTIEEQIFTPLCLRNNLNVIPEWKWHPMLLKDESKEIELMQKKATAIKVAIDSGLLDQEKGQKMFDDFLNSKEETI